MVTYPKILVSRDGTRAVRIDGYAGRGTDSKGWDAIVLRFDVALSPTARTTRALVYLDPLINGDLGSWGFTSLAQMEREDALVYIGLAALASQLATFTATGEPGVAKIECWDECLLALARTARASDDEILLYMKAKLYWAWKYDVTIIVIDWQDTLIIGASGQTVDRVTLAADGDYLRRTIKTSGAVLFEPLPKLLKEFPLLLSGDDGAPLETADVLRKLAAPRYAGPRLHMEKALGHASADTPDLPNATREAIFAVEGLARIVCSDSSATLGTLIDRLRGSGRLNGALAKSMAAVWGFASDKPGVRHGSPGSVELAMSEAEYVIGVSKAAIALLLPLDAPDA